VSGGALNVDDVVAICTQFTANVALSDVGGAIAIDGGGVITSSAFIGNIASSDGDHIYNFDSETATTAEFNWWDGSVPQVPDDVSSGVDADPDADRNHTIDKECLTLEDFGIVWEGDWLTGELEQILIGAIETGKALYAHGVTADSLVEAFRIVMEGVNGTEYRQIRFIKDSLSGTYCTTTPNPTSDFSAYITCDDGVDMTQYTTVHEFGHVFVGRTTVSGTSVFLTNVEYPNGTSGGALQDLDVDPNHVMGHRGYVLAIDNQDDWQRSDVIIDNGWGSAGLWDETSYFIYSFPSPPPPTPTRFPLRVPKIGPCGPGSPTLPVINDDPFNFQQNPCTFPNWEAVNPTGPLTEIEEGAADMFLNWVYWKNYGNSVAFQNQLWRSSTCYPSGCNDSAGMSGDVRSDWMDNTISDLFIQFNW
jgi:hypothetical protein